MNDSLWPEERDARTGVVTPGPAVDPAKMVIWDGVASLQTLVTEIDALEMLRPAGDEQEARKPDRKGGVVVSNPGIRQHSKSICDAFALASLTLFERKRLEKKADRDARAARAAMVDEACAGIDVSIFRDRRTRDRMVHTDEWVPRLVRLYPTSPWVTGLGLSHRNMFVPAGAAVPMIFNRVYIFDEGRILHLETELDVRALRASAMQVIDALF
jgi:hypothetical protein